MNQTLYRKYRPDSFSDVIGQEHITQILSNQIRLGRVGHAYLFAGSRGVGKTTCARIFARAINCENPQNGSPCKTCETCQKLQSANTLDIVEIDAASNNGVDDARELRERVKYPPVNGKYKVFIIDEVHMLTGSAFNALLKTLEEPPKFAVFILATTEAFKLPATILSRCMRFDFRLLPTDKLTRFIAGVYDAEGKKYEEDAVRFIAAAGEGSVRDALSVADKCISISDGTLTYTDVISILGAVSTQKIAGLFAAIAQADIGTILSLTNEAINAGKSVGQLQRDLISYARNILLAKTAPALLELADKEKSDLTAAAENISAELAVSVIQILSAADAELRYSLTPKIVLETACIRAAKLAYTDLAAFEERMSRLEKYAKNLQGAGQAVAPIQGAPQVGNNTAQSAAPPPIQSIPDAVIAAVQAQSTAAQPDHSSAQSTAGLTARVLFGKLLGYLRNNPDTGITYALISEQGDIELDGNTLRIYADENNYLMLVDENAAATLKAAAAALGHDINVEIDKRTAESLDKEIDRLKKLIGNTPFSVE